MLLSTGLSSYIAIMDTIEVGDALEGKTAEDKKLLTDVAAHARGLVSLVPSTSIA